MAFALISIGNDDLRQCIFCCECVPRMNSTLNGSEKSVKEVQSNKVVCVVLLFRFLGGLFWWICFDMTYPTNVI